MTQDKKELLNQLLALDLIQFGNFTLKSGIQSPFYVDYRPLVSHPALLEKIADQVWEAIKTNEFDFVCGVPYAALSLSSFISQKYQVPQVIKRKEKKKYGTKKSIEGHFQKGQSCVLIDDIITSGTSFLETASAIEAEGLKINLMVSLTDRNQGGTERLEKAGYKVLSLFRFEEIANHYFEEGKISKEQLQLTLQFIQENQYQEPKPVVRKTLLQKQAASSHKKIKKLVDIMLEKKSNLCCSADVNSKKELLDLADAVGPHICLLKTHMDILSDFDEQLLVDLKALAHKHHFLIFEDRKFADIGNTIMHQFTAGVHHITDWADFVTVHVIAGPKSIEAFNATGKTEETGLLVLAEMSSEANLMNADYTKAALDIAKNNPKAVCGIIGQKCTPPLDGQLLMTPGVKLQAGGDGHGQVYNTPTLAVSRGSDLLIVGRGIYQAENPAAAAQQYKAKGWEAMINQAIV